MTYIAVSGLSHVGLVRESHEDSLVVGPWTLCSIPTDSPQTLVFPLQTPLVVAVADGLGGHPGGELASGLVVRLLARAGPSLNDEQAIREALDDCNRMLYQAAAANPELTTMGTTVAGVSVIPDRLFAFNIGDSRIYRVVPDGLEQVSVDDRPSQRGLPSGIVTQTLGGHDEYAPIEAHLTSWPMPTDETVLICSDGLTDAVPTPRLAQILREHRDGRATFELWKAAIEAGGPDNITLALVRVASQDEPPPATPATE
ncbi:MAG TPA: PP2C family serine/threonine-protein phosphatase [Pseudonocardiaceae bacterium]|jgi:serine/threonine protein phosphatase PrpC